MDDQKLMKRKGALYVALAALLALFCGAEASAQLKMRNYTEAPIWVSVAYARQVDGEQTWIAEGWWKIETGQEATVIGERLENQFYYAFAFNEEGKQWKGGFKFVIDPTDVFYVEAADEAQTADLEPNYAEYTRFMEIEVGQQPTHTHTFYPADAD